MNYQNWKEILKLSVLTQTETKAGFEIVLLITKNLIDKHAPLEKLIKKQEKQQQKPWVTKIIKKSVDREAKYINNY